jgi:hypothetical protein
MYMSIKRYFGRTKALFSFDTKRTAKKMNKLKLEEMHEQTEGERERERERPTARRCHKPPFVL